MAANNLTREQRRNATSSWSGYLYQGKIGILVALKQLVNRLPDLADNESALKSLQLKYEYHEDFSIVDGETIISLHQVKAKTGKDNDKMSTYATAIKDFDGTSAPKDQRFLHVLANISDWKMDENDNTNHVQLYQYDNGTKFCSLLDDSVRQQCVGYITALGRPALEADIVYSSLLTLLADKVADCHARNDHSHPVITFHELRECIRNSVLEDIKFDAEIIKLRELMVRVLNETEEDIEAASLEKGASWEQAVEVVEQLCRLNGKNLVTALAKLHPDDSTFFDSRHLKSEGFKSVFIKVLRNIGGFNMLDNGYTKNGENYFLTNISDEAENAPGIAGRILKNTNNSKLLFEGKHIVTRDLEGEFSSFVGAGPDYDSKDIMNPEKMKFIKVETTLSNLKQDEA